jgi:hypothetical protein
MTKQVLNLQINLKMTPTMAILRQNISEYGANEKTDTLSSEGIHRCELLRGEVCPYSAFVPFEAPTVLAVLAQKVTSLRCS